MPRGESAREEAHVLHWTEASGKKQQSFPVAEVECRPDKLRTVGRQWPRDANSRRLGGKKRLLSCNRRHSLQQGPQQLGVEGDY